MGNRISYRMNSDLPEESFTQGIEQNIDTILQNEKEESITSPGEKSEINEELENEDIETELKKFIEMMKQSKTKCQIYFFHKPLHDLYLREPSNNEKLKSEYGVYKDKLNSMKDPESVDGQKLVSEKNRMNYWDSLFNEAQEKIPNISPLYSLPFLTIVMPYVRIEINGAPAVALVDTGADSSMMSSWFAQKADVEHAIDTRYPTLFEGVGGLAKTQGEILCSLEIGSFQFDVSMHVMDSDYDVMIGLDFIRRHKCRIDFTEKRLIVDNNAHIKMLSCSEIDEYFASREAPFIHQVKVDDEKLAELCSIGFDETNAKHVLEYYINDMNDAVRCLYNWSEKEDKKPLEETKSHVVLDAHAMIMNCSAHIQNSNGWNFVHNKRRKNNEKSLATDNELKCKNLFKAMHFPVIKLSIYRAWRPLHDQYIKDPTNYESFKREHANYIENEVKINDPRLEEGREYLRKELANKNYDKIQTWSPSSHRLYIEITVNGLPVLAFVDTGYTSTTISLSFAIKCGLESDIDTRYRHCVSGIAGVERICGTVHICSLGIGGSEYNTSARIMEGPDEIIIGKDFLNNYGCIIDMSRNRISINDDMRVKFQSKKQIRKWIANNRTENDYVSPVFTVDESQLNELVKMGFERNKAQKALRFSLNDIDFAARQLYWQTYCALKKTTEDFWTEYESEFDLWRSLRL